ncbi:MAG: ABC transporter substrate-binding protein [Sedimenticola sp.]
MKVGHIFKDLFTAALLLIAVAYPLTAVSDELEPPQQVIQGISDQLYEVLKRDRDRVMNEPGYVNRLANDILIPHVDFTRVSKLVLGKHWRRATPEQQKSFSYQFQRLLVRTYATAFREFDEWEVKHMPIKAKAGAKSLSVRTMVHRPGAQAVEVVYRMRNGDDGWKAYDVKIEGISLVTNYRSSFAKEMRKGGMDRLITRIAELNDSRVKKVASVGTPQS